MRPLTALLILAVCQCLHAHQYPRTPQHLVKGVLHKLLDKQITPVRHIVTCARTLGVSKCVSALGVWRAERALNVLLQDSTATFNLTEDLEKFKWKRYVNTTDDQLYTQLLDKTQKLLQYRSLDFDMIPGYNAKLSAKSNGSVRFDIHHMDEVEGRSSIKKIQKEALKFAPILLAPGIIISAILPFILPSLKMMVLMVGFINQMALSGAVFTLLRNNAFNDKYNHRIIYVNDGYKNEKIPIAQATEEHYHTDHLGILYEDPKIGTRGKPIKDPDFEEFGNFEEIPPLSVNPQWIKEYTDNKMIGFLKDQPNGNIFYNGGIPVRRSKT